MTDDKSGDRPDDASGDMSGDSRWMTYDELAKLRGITRPSAERLVQRRRWRRQQGNDRTVRVLVPVDSLSDDVSAEASDDISPDTRRLLVDAMAALESAVATLRAQLDRAEAGKEAADRHADRERS
jgi:hypothetical protein